MPDKKTEFKQTVAQGATGQADGDSYKEDVVLTSTEADQVARNAGVQPPPAVK